jgi:predicted ATPase
MPDAHGTRFVGRHAELHALRAELDAALSGEGRLVVLLGEPGIGKTRVALALAAEARERGAAVAWGRCHESDGARYWPWLQVLGARRRPPGAAVEDLAAARAAPVRRTGRADAHEVPSGLASSSSIGWSPR